MEGLIKVKLAEDLLREEAATVTNSGTRNKVTSKK